MKNNKLIVVTGIDGSGKDFVAEHLHLSEPKSTLLTSPSEPFLLSRLGVDSFALKIPAAHYFFYLAGNIHTSYMAEKALNKGHVFCVRYLIDTVVYHRAMGLDVKLEYETALYKIRKPDLVIFLYVDNESVRQSRLSTRGKITIGDEIVNNSLFRESLIKEYLSFADEMIIVNNTDKGITDVIAEIKAYL